MEIKRSSHSERVKNDVLAVGLRLWREGSLLNTPSLLAIAKAVELTHGAILYHFGTSEALQDALAREAVASGCKQIIPLLIAANHAAVADLSDSERRAYLAGC